MMSLVATVGLASLFGSLHCAGMCGPLVTLYVGEGSRHVGHLAYNGGRLISYAGVGALAGAIGSTIDQSMSWTGVQRISAFLAAGAIVLVALAPLLPARWKQRSRRSRLGQLIGRLLGALRSLPPVLRAGSVGVLSSLLPCGWLYAFVAIAAGTGTPGAGALVMFAFWLGTVPILVASGYGLQSLLTRWRLRRPWVTAALLLAIGATTVLGRADHVGLGLPTQAETTDEQLDRAVNEEPACCHGDD